MGEFSPPPLFLSPLLFFSHPSNIDAQTSNTYIITKIHPPFRNPGSGPGCNSKVSRQILAFQRNSILRDISPLTLKS